MSRIDSAGNDNAAVVLKISAISSIGAPVCNDIVIFQENNTDTVLRAAVLALRTHRIGNDAVAGMNGDRNAGSSVVSHPACISDRFISHVAGIKVRCGRKLGILSEIDEAVCRITEGSEVKAGGCRGIRLGHSDRYNGRIA